MTDDLSLEDALALLEEPEPREVPEQKGPLRWIDKPMRCACRGCSSETYCKVDGIPRCMTHALKELNYLILQLHRSIGILR